MAKAIAKKTGTTMDMFSDDRPDYISDESHRGSEDVGMDDIILPRIDVIQALSPQIKKSDAKYIEGAEQGKIYNRVVVLGAHTLMNKPRKSTSAPKTTRRPWRLWIRHSILSWLCLLTGRAT